MRTRTSLLASLVVAAVLAGLGVASWSALASIRDAQQATLGTRESAIAYNDVRAAVASEAIAEAGYRRAPSTAARARLEDAITGVDRALESAHSSTARRDGPVLANLKLLNQRYVDQVRSTLDRQSAGADDRVAGPALDSIQRLLEAAIASHRADLNHVTRSEIATANRLQWLLPAAFAVALAVVGWTLRKLLAEHRRVGNDAENARELARTRAELLVDEQRQVVMLRDLERAREDFLAMVSHDLVNPMTVIDWYAELITEAPDLSPEIARQAAAIRDRARQVQRLVSDLGRGASPSSLTEATEVALDRVVGDAVEATKVRAADTGIALTSRLTPSTIEGDADRLRQVVDNLLGNALKYTPAGGRVDVEVSEHSGHAVLRITDTGIGIPADQLDHVFDTYYRASTAADAGISGTGLGLAITKSIVEGHGGTITAASTQPRGTTFVVRIPMQHARAKVRV